MKKRLTRAVSCLLCLSLLLGIVAPAAAAVEDSTAPQSVSNGEYEIYPTPHMVTYGAQGSTVALPDTMKVAYGNGIDQYTKDRAVEAFAEAGVTLDESADTAVALQVSVKGSADTVATETADLFDKYDAYKLVIDGSGVTVIGKDTDAAFYGLTTVKRILQQVEDKTVRTLTVEDYADVPLRGFIEGYYGNPWTVEDRAALMEYGGELKMNIYFYAPKDDPKHNAEWREKYTQDELENKIRPLAEAGNASKCYFGFALHPFMNNPISFASDAAYEADLTVLKEKFEQVMEVGVRQIAVLGDDAAVPAGGGASYVRLMQDLTDWVSSDEMQAKYPGLKTTIPFCPNDYMSNASSAQMQALKALPESVPIIQTGGAIWGSVSNNYLTTYRNNMGDRGVFMWINWPCSDQSKGSLIMGAHDTVLRSDLTQDDIDTLKGIMLNPMQQSEPSKAAIFQNADYAWNVWNGGDSAQRIQNVWDDCFKYVDHDSAIETPESNALKELSKHMIHNNGSGWRGDWHESAELKDSLNDFRNKLSAGSVAAADITAMRGEFEKLYTAADLYKSKTSDNTRILGRRNADGSYPNNQEQMAPWLDYWVEFTQANLKLLDALALSLDNGSGASDNQIVERYLEGQALLEAARSHKFWYIDHYETAIAGGEYIAPLTNDLAAAVAEAVKTIIDPTVLVETIITSRTDTPAGGLEAMRDGSTATEAVFKDPNSIAEGTYVGVRYNRTIPITSVRFEVGTASNPNDTFGASKLQYMDANGNWQDIPGAVFTHSDLVLEASGLSLEAKGVRVIATEERASTWLGIKEIYINGQSGGNEPAVDSGKLSGTVIKSSTWSVYQPYGDSKATDGDDGTYAWYDTGATDDSMVGDFFGLDLGSVQTVGRVRFLMGDNKWTNYKLQYSEDNSTWTDAGAFTSEEADTDLGGVSARYIRFVNTQQVHSWVKVCDISVYSSARNDAGKIAYQSETVGRLTKPVAKLTDDSAALRADAVILKPNEFVGIALPRIRAITDIAVNYTTVSGLVLEVGANKDEMQAVNLAARTPYNVNARYIRLRNASNQAVSFKLNTLSVQSDEITDIHLDEEKTNMGFDGAYGYQDNRESLNFFDGNLGTVTTLANAQTAGEYVTYDLGQTRPIKKLAMAMQESNTNYLRHGVLEVSPDGETWTTVLTIDNDGDFESEVKDGASSDPSFKMGVPQQNYVSFVGELDSAVNARYLRIRVTRGGSTRFVAAAEILINTESLNDVEYLPAVNDPTFEANPIEQAGYAPANMTDGSLTTAFRPNMDGETSGSVVYRLSDHTGIGQINVLEGSASGATVSVRPVGGSSFQALGTLSGGLNQVAVPDAMTGVAEIKLSWTNATPTIYELITVPREAEETGGGQASSGSETVPINSYSGSDCTILFDENWKFSLGDASGASAAVYNDSTWRTVNLPHDFSIEQEYTSAGEAESGYLLGGTGWYRKSFTVAQDWVDKTVTIDFGGAYMDTEVYLNGTKLGEHHYGYSPFSFVLPSNVLNYTGENVIAVKVTNTVPSSRWYSGSGIYRSVYLTVSEPVHVAQYGTKVETTNAGAVTVKTNVQNDGTGAANVTVQQEIFKLNGSTFEKSGGAVATDTSDAVSVAAGATQTVAQSLTVSNPDLWNSWDQGTPNLYVLVTTVKQGETVLDTYETEFGFRTIEFTAAQGFKLNGQTVKLKGVCQHHDQGALGAEAWYRALERQVEILMDMGCNSIRVTHNPAADELIEICNRKGVLVIDEFFDGWTKPKNGNSGDFARWFNQTIGSDNALVGKKADETWAQFVVEIITNRDKNAPSVIMYSMGNEVQEGTSGYDNSFLTAADNIISWTQAIDLTRPLTRGSNGRSTGSDFDGQINQKIHDAGGVVGFNYGNEGLITAGHNKGWVMYSSETASAVNSRGVYNIKGSQALNSDKLLTSYDKSCVGWGALASDAWWRTIRYDYNAGEYVWTGFDYIGEPTPNNGTGTGWANGANSPKSSFFGIVDTNGLPKDSYYFYQAMWNEKVHTLHVLPTWDREDLMIDSSGKVEVVVYTDAPMVKLYLNDVEVGTAASTEQRSDGGLYTYRTFTSGTGAFDQKSGHQSLYATFNVTYAEGTLKAVACDASGNELNWVTQGRSQVKSTSGAARLEVSHDRATIKNDGRDLSYITIDVVDASGEIVNGATPEITVSVTGDGVLVGLDNGVQPDHTSYLSNTRKAGAGRLVAIVQSTKTAGSFTVRAAANGLEAGSTRVTTSGAASTVDQNAPVSYDIAKTIYVQRGVMPDLPSTASVTRGNGAKETGTITWDDSWDHSLLNTVGNEFAITGTIAITGYSIPVSVGVVVVDNVVAMLNYSTVIRLGETPRLPDTRPAIMADGTVLTAQFPVTWTEPAAAAYRQTGMAVVSGTAEVFGKTLPVTAWVRVSEGGVAEGGSVSNAAVRPTVDGVDDAELLKAYDGNADTAWSGRGETSVSFDTAQNLYRIKLTYSGYAPAAGNVAITLDGGPVTVTPTIEGSTATYELGGIHSSEHVTIDFANQVSLAEVELISGTPTFDTYSTAELDGLKFNGQNALASALASRVIRTPLQLPAIVPVTDSNVAYTMLPENNGRIIIVTESEDGSRRDMYTVYLGAPADVSATDASRDYPYANTTATAGSDNGNTVGSAVDGNESTIWHSAYNNGSAEANAADKLTGFPEKRWFQLELDEAAELVALRYKPRPSQTNGTVKDYRIEVSEDGVTWTTISTGTWDSSANWKVAMFDQAVTAKYVKLWGDNTYGDGSQANYFMAAAEVRVVMADSNEKEDLSLANVSVYPTEFQWTGVRIRPVTVSVDLFGETLTEGVDYRLEYEDNLNPGTAYVYAVALPDSDYQGSTYGTFTIVRTDTTVEEFEPRTIWIQEGAAPTLPVSVWALMSDGSHLAQVVDWDSVPADKYMNPAADEFTVSGNVEGTDKRPVLTVRVARAQSVDSVSAMTAVGTEPNLPRTVNVQFNDGSSRRCAVTWSMPAATAWENVGIVTVTGAVDGISGITATASVRVATGSQSSTNIALNDDSGSKIFPFAMGFVSAGNNNPYQAIKGTTTGSTAQTDRWSDWERDTYHTDPESWLGVAFETSTTLSGRQQGQVLSLRPHLVNQVKVMFVDEAGSNSGAVTYPESYKIQYYTGQYTGLTFDTRISSELDKSGNGLVRAWAGSPLLNDANWQDVALTGGDYPAVPAANGQMLTIDFEPVQTTIIRVLCTPKTGKWSGIQALEVYGLELPSAKSDFTVTSITLGGAEKLTEFDRDKVLEVELGANEAIPDLAVTVDSGDNASVSVTQASRVPGMPQPGVAWATAAITSEDGSKTETYTVKFTRAGAPDGYPIEVTGPDADKITLSSNYAKPGATITVRVAEGYTISNPWAMITWCAHPGNIHAGQHIDVMDNQFTMREGNVEFSATVSIIRYPIILDLDGGEETIANFDSYTVESPTFTLRNPVKEGYTFLGWTGMGLTEPTETVTIETGTVTGELRYTANWKENEEPEKPDKPGPVGPTGPVYPVSDTTTTVVKNEDGSTTTTVTNNKTGLITVDTEKPDGSKVVKVTEPDKDVTITATSPEGEVLAKVEIPAVMPESPVKFVDVPDGHWAEGAIYQAAGLGLVKGVGDNVFEWNGSMKRGDLAVILHRMSNGGEDYELTFDDVPADKYYAGSVAWAVVTKVVTGYSETTFGPENTITREELAVMLYRYAGLLNLDTKASGDELDAFADGASISSWAVDGMTWCVKNGIIKGVGDDTLAPGINTTRAEVVLMLQRFMELMK